MDSFFPRIDKSWLVKSVLGIVLLHGSIHGDSDESFISRKESKTPEELHNTPSVKDIDNKDTYTINFNNVSIIEYIRFASKITNLNFIFNDDDLQFNVTIVSEEPVTPKNIMSILIQVLRINGLVVLEQDNNLLITKVRSVSQLATVVSSDLPEVRGTSPIVTRVFRIKNASLTTVASVIKPMLSDSALLEMSPETKQLIITDITTNVDKISTLLASIDAPHISLEVDNYVAKRGDLDSLIKLATQIITPFSEGNPITFVPQPSTGTIFIVSTPALIDRAMTILEDLDIGVEEGKEAEVSKSGQTFYLYKLKNAQGNVVLDSLKKVASDLKDSQIPDQPLISTLKNIKWIKDNNSLLITGPAASVEQARTLVDQFDSITAAPSAITGKSSFFIYKPLYQTPDAIQSALKDIGSDLEGSGLVDPDLLLTINTMKVAESTNSLLFTGTPGSLDKIKELLTGIDIAAPSGAQIQQIGETTFLIYKIQYVPAPQLINSIKNFAADLHRTGAADRQVVDSISNVKWIKETNSLLFTGSKSTLEKVEGMVKKFDVASMVPIEGGAIPSPTSTFIVYTPKYLPGDELVQILKDFEQNLISSGVMNKNLFDTICNLKWIPRTCSIIVAGDTESINKVQELLTRFDVPTSEPASLVPSIESIQNTSFLIYKLQFHQGSEIVTALKQIATDLGPGTATGNQNLLNAINSLQWIRVTNSLLASGEAETLSKLRDLIQNLDVPLRQVFIEILVIETDLSNTQNFGLQWGGKVQYLNKFAAGFGNFPVTNGSVVLPVNAASTGVGTGIASPGLSTVNATTFPNANTMIPFVNGFDLGVIGDIIFHKGRSFISLGSLVDALQTDVDSTIVMNPKIITQDNRTSTIFVGTNIPFVGSLVTTSANIVSATSNIEYRDIGFNLTVTPTIGSQDIVTLDISNDISSVINTPTIGTTNASNQTSTIVGITSSHTSMTTRVHVPDKHFVILSGMIQDSKARYRSGFPCLGGLPVIGAAFSENDRVNTKFNIVIFMCPHIVNTYEDYRRITENQENLFKDSAVLPVLKEEFDAGLDLVQTPETE